MRAMGKLKSMSSLVMGQYENIIDEVIGTARDKIRSQV
jgi:hypothetical protein